MADLNDAITIASHGMRAQSMRLKVTAENIANADSVSTVPGGKPYQRKTVTFKNVLDRELGVNVVKVDKVGNDSSPFLQEYEPGHPAADKDGYVLKPNVNTMFEAMDMREAQRSYEANLNAIDISKSMISRTLDLMR